MSTMNEECARLLDSGWIVRLMKSHHGSYTAIASTYRNKRWQFVDGPTPEEAISRVTKKVIDAFGEEMR